MAKLQQPEDISEAILVTHRGCLDGSGCSVMFLAAGGKKENIRYVAAGQVERFIKDERVLGQDKFLIFADVGLNLPKYADLLERRGRCVILDHHKTSLHLVGRDWCNIEMDACGTELLRRYLVDGRLMKEQMSDAYRKFSAIVDDHDRWFRNDPRSSDLAQLMLFYGQERFVEKFKRPELRFIDEGFWTIEENSLLPILTEQRNESIKYALKRVQKKEVSLPQYFSLPVKVAYLISSNKNVSLLLDEVLVHNTDCQIAAQVDFDRNMVSLRSRGDFDVAEFAAIFGGGGHRAAAGHSLQKWVSSDILDDIHKAGE